MSLDVYVSTKCEACGHEEHHGQFNCTYNLGQFWRDALAAVGETPPGETNAANEAFGPTRGLSFGAWLEKAGAIKTAGGIAPTLRVMLSWMRQQDASKYDSSNGWGSGRDGIDFVEAIATCCELNPKARLSVWR